MNELQGTQDKLKKIESSLGIKEDEKNHHKKKPKNDTED